MIIGISGKKESGKDSLASVIQWHSAMDRGVYENPLGVSDIMEQFKAWKAFAKSSAYLSGWDNRKYAGVLKEHVCRLTGCTMEQLEDPEFKESKCGKEWWYYKQGSKMLDYLTYVDTIEQFDPEDIELVKLTYRNLMELIGTDGGRLIVHPNMWINGMFATYDPKQRWLITDVRFPNEAEAIKKRKGILIRVDRPDKYDTGNHPSETSLDDYMGFDYNISSSQPYSHYIEFCVEFYKKVIRTKMS